MDIGYLKDNTPFAHVFPDGKVPLKSIIAGIPREEGAPHCYWIDGSKLSSDQVEQLAQMLLSIPLSSD